MYTIIIHFIGPSIGGWKDRLVGISPRFIGEAAIHKCLESLLVADNTQYVRIPVTIAFLSIIIDRISLPYLVVLCSSYFPSVIMSAPPH